MMRKFACAPSVAALAIGLLALASSPAGARGCKPDPNPNGRDHCSIKCPACYQVVCTVGGRCPYSCEVIPGCTP